MDFPILFSTLVEKPHRAAKRAAFLYLEVTNFTPLDHMVKGLKTVREHDLMAAESAILEQIEMGCSRMHLFWLS